MTAPPVGLCRPAKVIRVIDGDTIEVEIRTVVTVRLLDCWAPETKGEEKPRGLKAKAHMQDLVGEQPQGRVLLPLPEDGSLQKSITMGRVLGQFWRDGDETSIAEQMVATGHATTTKQKK